MSLYTETLGAGPRVVLVHGWGLHGGVWRATAEALAPRCRVTLVDLPGHGRSPFDAAQVYTLEHLAQTVARAVPEPAVWVGWSLGGMVATQIAATCPRQTRGLVLVASSPQFTQDPDWPPAMPPALLDGFARELERDYRATVQRFIALQTRGSDQAREELRQLRQLLFAHGEPHLAALRGGLQLLRECRLHAALADVRCPVQFIMGAHDTLVPAQAAELARRALPEAQVTVIPRAGHAPFLSHPREFLAELNAFLDEHHRD